jgi:hypothetical protein
MKAKRLPQEDIVLEVIENLHEVVWAEISSGVKKFISPDYARKVLKRGKDIC